MQYLSLALVLERLNNAPPAEPRAEDHNSPPALWNLAHILSLNDVAARESHRVEWAYGNLVEIYLLALLLPVAPAGLQPNALVERAVQRARDLVDRAGPDSFTVYSTRRQIVRYEDWYAEIASITAILEPVGRVLAVLPESDRQAWE